MHIWRKTYGVQNGSLCAPQESRQPKRWTEADDILLLQRWKQTKIWHSM